MTEGGGEKRVSPGEHNAHVSPMSSKHIIGDCFVAVTAATKPPIYVIVLMLPVTFVSYLGQFTCLHFCAWRLISLCVLRAAELRSSLFRGS